MLAAANVGRRGAGPVADSIVTLDDDAANPTLPKLDGGGKTNRTGTDDNNVSFPVSNPAHGRRQPLRCRQTDMGGHGIRQVFASPHRLLQGAEIGAGLELVVYYSQIEKRPNRVFGKLSGRPYKLAGLVPVAERVALQLDEIAFRVLVVERNRYFVVETECGLDAFLTQAVERYHQVVKAVVLKCSMMHAVVADLLRIVGQAGHCKECDAVVGGVVRGP